MRKLLQTINDFYFGVAHMVKSQGEGNDSLQVCFRVLDQVVHASQTHFLSDVFSQSQQRDPQHRRCLLLQFLVVAFQVSFVLWVLFSFFRLRLHEVLAAEVEYLLDFEYVSASCVCESFTDVEGKGLYGMRDGLQHFLYCVHLLLLPEEDQSDANTQYFGSGGVQLIFWTLHQRLANPGSDFFIP